MSQPWWTVVARNGALLLVPVLAITFGLWARLPAVFGNAAFDEGVPARLLAVENVLRVAVFALPLLLYFSASDTLQRLGWFLYIAGLALYLASYLAQIFAPASAWSQSVIGFTALAWTTVPWLAGIGLVCADTWLPLPWNRLIYLLCAAAFVVAHTAHAWLAWSVGRPS